jgi:hypothetical protein
MIRRALRCNKERHLLNNKSVSYTNEQESKMEFCAAKIWNENEQE